jgi:hypothetical protein
MEPMENSLSIVEVHLPSDCIAMVMVRAYRKQVMWSLASDFIGGTTIA